MNYPEWAPEFLVQLHKARLDGSAPDSKCKMQDPAIIIDELKKKHGGNITKENIENIRRNFYRKAISGLPDKESTALLGLLITDLRMRHVWKALARRVENDEQFLFFFRACEEGITGWRGQLKLTSAEQKAFYRDILDTAAKLQKLLNQASEFDFYSIDDLVDDQHVEWLLEVLNAPNEISYARFSLSEVIPHIFIVLNDIGKKAAQYAEEDAAIRKLNSPNAEIHFFIRGLSGYLQRSYNQPLHDAVAITTTVIFDKENIGTDYVRKIVKR